MLELAINAVSRFFSDNSKMKLSIGDNVENLKCRIVEISEQQNYNIPNSPVDDGNFRSDTIYRMPLILNVRVYVKSKDIDNFISNVKIGQFSNQTFNVYSLYDKIYKNMKIISYARETNALVLGATHFNIQMQEIIFVKALVENYKNSKKAGYASKKELGNKNPQERKKSALFSSGKSLGAF